MLQRPVAVSDGGFYFHGLGGFPGPFIKFINAWLTGEDLFRLLDGVKDRRIEAIECISYCQPGGEPKAFCHSFWGSAALQIGQPGKGPIDQIFIPEGFNTTTSSISEEDQIKFWGSGGSWRDLAAWLRTQ